VLRSLAIGRRWLELALEHDLPQAQNFYGTLYRDGRGVRRDKSAAATWFRKAADQGEPKAIQNLGLAYLTGDGITRDVDEAEDLLARSARLGLPQSQFMLARLYITEEFSRQDYERAYAWLLVCKDRKIDQCVEELEKLEPKLDESQIARATRLADEYRQPIESDL
jgi:TPR repeat protein